MPFAILRRRMEAVWEGGKATRHYIKVLRLLEQALGGGIGTRPSCKRCRTERIPPMPFGFSSNNGRELAVPVVPPRGTTPI